MTAITEMIFTGSIFNKVNGMKLDVTAFGQKVATVPQQQSSAKECIFSAGTTGLVNWMTFSSSTSFLNSGHLSTSQACWVPHQETPMYYLPMTIQYTYLVDVQEIRVPTSISLKLMKIYGLLFKVSKPLQIKPQAPVSAMLAKFWKIICISLGAMTVSKD